MTATALASSSTRHLQVAAHDQRLSDVGVRIAQVVHELNVPISLVVGSLQTLEQFSVAAVHYIRASAKPSAHGAELTRLRSELDLDYLVEHAGSLLEICREGSRRLNYVVQQLKIYTRTADGIPTARVDIVKVLREATSLAGYGREASPNVHFETAAIPTVVGVAESLSQVFVNIVGNAFDAVTAISDAQVWVSTRADWPVAGVTQPRGWVEISIRDNGPGVPAEYRRRIFEPFFTTKSRRSGMGLGLAIAREIVERHGGTIALSDSATPGTTVVIRLPVDAAAWVAPL